MHGGAPQVHRVSVRNGLEGNGTPPTLAELGDAEGLARGRGLVLLLQEAEVVEDSSDGEPIGHEWRRLWWARAGEQCP
jgi:hypothetical protein